MQNATYKQFTFLFGRAICTTSLLMLVTYAAFADDGVNIDRAASAKFWATQLGSDNYYQRVRASEKLSELGRDAIPAVTRRAIGNDLEASVRSVNLLAELLVSEDLETAFEAFEALGQISRAGQGSVASRAHTAARRMQPQAIDRLEEMGVEFNFSFSALTIGPTYRGGDKGLVWLRFLWTLQTVRIKECDLPETALARLASAPQLNEVVLDGYPLTDIGLKQISKVARLEILHASGTDVSSQAMSKLCQQRELSWCDLSHTSVNNALVKTLAQQKRLEGLDIRGTKITAAGADEIRQSLPRTKVLH